MKEGVLKLSETRCIKLEYPKDDRRMATIITNDENICRYLEMNPDAKLGIFIIND